MTAQTGKVTGHHRRIQRGSDGGSGGMDEAAAEHACGTLAQITVETRGGGDASGNDMTAGRTGAGCQQRPGAAADLGQLRGNERLGAQGCGCPDVRKHPRNVKVDAPGDFGPDQPVLVAKPR
jgi:hypothetical protein